MTNQKITIVTDSSAYIPKSAQEGLDIAVIPLWLIWDDDRFQDGVDIDPQTFYDRLKKSSTLPTSSQPSAKEFEIFYRQVTKECDAIVSVLVSSKISGTVDCAQMALSEFQDFPIRIVDALSSSMGLGFVVLAAARAAAAGGEVARICSSLVFGYNRHPCWTTEGDRVFDTRELTVLENVMPGLCSCTVDVLDEEGEPPLKRGPCVTFAGYEPFTLRRGKLDGCLTGSRLAKDNAAKALTEVTIPEALDYPL